MEEDVVVTSGYTAKRSPSRPSVDVRPRPPLFATTTLRAHIEAMSADTLLT
jgi:hypothetical protein